jgi:gas vesicle protein
VSGTSSSGTSSSHGSTTHTGTTPGGTTHTGTSHTGSTPGGTSHAGTSSSGSTPLKDQVKDASKTLKDKAASMASTSTDTVKDRASDFVDAAKGMAGSASDKLYEAVDDQKQTGADYIGRIAETIRRAGREVEKEIPFVGPYVRQAASQVDQISETVRNGDVSDLMTTVQDFARRQPMAFLGITTLAGFAAVRFIKSSSTTSSSSTHSYTSSSSRGGSSMGGTSYAARSSNPEKGYHDGFSK